MIWLYGIGCVAIVGVGAFFWAVSRPEMQTVNGCRNEHYIRTYIENREPKWLCENAHIPIDVLK
jgi:hypothetical protein